MVYGDFLINITILENSPCPRTAWWWFHWSCHLLAWCPSWYRQEKYGKNRMVTLLERQRTHRFGWVWIISRRINYDKPMNFIEFPGFFRSSASAMWVTPPMLFRRKPFKVGERGQQTGFQGTAEAKPWSSHVEEYWCQQLNMVVSIAMGIPQ